MACCCCCNACCCAELPEINPAIEETPPMIGESISRRPMCTTNRKEGGQEVQKFLPTNGVNAWQIPALRSGVEEWLRGTLREDAVELSPERIGLLTDVEADRIQPPPALRPHHGAGSTVGKTVVCCLGMRRESATGQRVLAVATLLERLVGGRFGSRSGVHCGLSLLASARHRRQHASQDRCLCMARNPHS